MSLSVFPAIPIGVAIAAAFNLMDLHIRICIGPVDTCKAHWSQP